MISLMECGCYSRPVFVCTSCFGVFAVRDSCNSCRTSLCCLARRESRSLGGSRCGPAICRTSDSVPVRNRIWWYHGVFLHESVCTCHDMHLSVLFHSQVYIRCHYIKEVARLVKNYASHTANIKLVACVVSLQLQRYIRYGPAGICRPR